MTGFAHRAFLSAALFAGAIAVLLSGLAAPIAPAGAAKPPQRLPAPPDRPNFVVIQTDDQTRQEMLAKMRNRAGKWIPVMPATNRLIGDRGISFDNHYATNPLCCPSRVTFLTGRYSHSHRVYTNSAPLGGWDAFRRSPAYRHNLAVWLRGAGYRTAHIGKLMNEYGTDEAPATTVPPGWAWWETDATDNSARHFYGYLMNINGTIRGPFGDLEYGRQRAVDPPGCLHRPVEDPECNHKTDLITRRAVTEIGRAAKVGNPFYLQLDYNAPHGDHQPPIGPEPTPRNYDRAAMTPIPRPPSFNEPDISDKPSFIRDVAEKFDERTMRRIRTEYRKNLESLRDVDDGVRRIIGELGRRGLLRRTYIIFTSDNGFFHGEHRLDRAKFLPYQPAVHMPLLIRGPRISPGTESLETTANIDLAPTILELAGTWPRRARHSVEGRPLVPFFEDPEKRTRRPILLESFAGARHLEDARALVDGRRRPVEASASLSAPPESYVGVLHSRYKYIEYANGERELYDLMRDPHELRNEARNRAYRRVRGFLAHQLNRLVDCRGAECRITTGPLPRPRKRP